MGDNLTSLDVFMPVPTSSRDERRRASLNVTARARDMADATQLLAALGLLPKGHPATLRQQNGGAA